MATKEHQIPTTDEIKSRVLDELRYRLENWRDLSIASYADVGLLVDAVQAHARTDLDPELEWKLKCRTKSVLRRMERDGLVAHWVQENWYLTDVGAKYRSG